MTWQFACKRVELQERPQEIMLGTIVIALFETDHGVFATDAMCAHQGGPLAQGTVDGKCLTCPWHGWQYDVSTGMNLLTKRKMLATYPVEFRGDEVWVDA